MEEKPEDIARRKKQRGIEKADEAKTDLTKDETDNYIDERTAYRNAYDENLEAIIEKQNIDTLTGAFRREVLFNQLESVLKIIYEHKKDSREGEGKAPERVSLIFIDLDNFKQVNDTRGHDAGDRALKRTGEILKKELRRGDVLGRYGGDEFFVLLPNATQAVSIGVAERILSAIQDDGLLKEFDIGASIGVCSSETSKAEDAETFIRHADKAAYTAKRAGRNRVAAYQ